MNSSATIKIPLSGIKFISRKPRAKKILCEIDFSKFKKINKPATLDDLIGEARFDHATGQTKKFNSTKKLMNFLEN